MPNSTTVLRPHQLQTNCRQGDMDHSPSAGRLQSECGRKTVVLLGMRKMIENLLAVRDFSVSCHFVFSTFRGNLDNASDFSQ